LFQLCSDLNERVSVIVTTNLRFADWNSIFGDNIMTTALLDKLTSKGHIIEFIGESYRFRQRMKMEEQATATETG
jgi:DNA replication protein DnaC